MATGKFMHTRAKATAQLQELKRGPRRRGRPVEKGRGRGGYAGRVFHCAGCGFWHVGERQKNTHKRERRPS